MKMGEENYNSRISNVSNMGTKLFICQALVFLHLFALGVEADRTRLKIYEDIQSDIFCFRRLNSTHQIGCSSHRNGNIGVVLVVDNEEELLNVTSNPPYSSYVVALPINLFNMGNMTLLKHAAGIEGVIILHQKEQLPPKMFSPEQSCPNRNFGFYTEAINPKYSACQRLEWNRYEGNLALGMMYIDWGMPIFAITNETSIARIRKLCYETFNQPQNGTARTWPLCSVQLNSVMLGAKDSATCMRRSKVVANLNQVKTCDPLSDKNIVTMLFPANKSEEIANRSVILVACRLDAFSMFDRLAPGAHSTVTGLVALLTVAKTMARVRDELLNTTGENGKNIMFAIFNGEAFDYIGSSRVVFDMEKGVFPVALDDKISDQPANLSLRHISHIIELSQLAPLVQQEVKTNPTYWVHTDPVSSDSSPVKEEVLKMFNLLKSASASSKFINITKTESKIPLPPASFQSFLRRDRLIPGIVIADHQKEFTNRYYNSMFDTDDTLSSSSLSQMLADLATAVSVTLYELLTGNKPEGSLEADENLVSGLLECYLRNASCDLFRQIADPSMTERLRVEPYPLYISVHTGGHTKANAITLYTRYMLAYLTGSILEDRTRKNCTSDNKTQIYHYDWMTGKDSNGSGICVKSTVMYTVAESPANELDDWKSTEYSTWTESVWLETSARIFLQPSKEQEIVTLVTGIFIFLFSIACVYFINKRASIIFNLKPLISC